MTKIFPSACREVTIADDYDEDCYYLFGYDDYDCFVFYLNWLEQLL